MKKALFLIVPSLSLGGQEHVCTITAELLKMVYNVTVIIFDGRNKAFFPSCEVIDLNLPPTHGKINIIFNALKRAFAVRKLRKDRNVAFVYSFGSPANLANVLSFGKGKTFIGLRGFATANRGSLVDKFLYKHCDLIIGCAEETCTPVRRLKAATNKTVCLYNPLDVERIKEQSKAQVEDYAFVGPTVVSHGRLNVIKNWPRLIKAFYLVRKKITDAQLLIIGEGEQREELQQLIVAYELTDAVTLIGFRENPFAYLSKSSMYVLPSFSEGFPNSLIEGMTFLPVVAVDCKSGPREILSEDAIGKVTVGVEYADYGILVQPALDYDFHNDITKDDELLAEAMLNVLLDKERANALKAAAAARVYDFSCEHYLKRLIDILEH